MQSENGILLLFYIFLSHGNGGKKKKKNEKRGDAVSCPQVPVIRIWYVIHNEMVFPKENLCERAILVNLCPNVLVLPGVEVINLD